MTENASFLIRTKERKLTESPGELSTAAHAQCGKGLYRVSMQVKKNSICL